jgi:hypothetical protein
MFDIYKGKIKTTLLDDTIKISIPSDRNWFLLVGLSIFLGIWLTVEFLFFTGQIFQNLQSAFPFLLWFLGWTACGLLAIRIWLWQTIGKTIITKENDILTIRKKWMLFSRLKQFEIFEIKKFFIQNSDMNRINIIARKNHLFPRPTKTFAFEYKNKIIRAVDCININDAEFLLAKLKE